MELRQLRYLVAVAEESGFTRAADRLLVAQPGLSAQIGSLERELGVRLFDRTPYGATPTEAGMVLLAHARRVLAGVDAARADLDELRNLITGSVVFGLVRGAPLGELAEVLGAFRRAHPGVAIALREDESDALLAGLRAGSVDLALVGLAGPAPDDLTTRVVLADRLVAVVGADDPWASRRSIDLEALARHTIVTLPAGTGMRTALDRACRDVGVELAIAFEVSAVLNALELVRQGLAVAVLPSAAAGLADDLRPVPVVRPVVRSRLVLAWSTAAASTGRPATRALVTAVRKHLRATPEGH